jgi:hypothetical protein
MIRPVGVICDRCGKGYRLHAPDWPGNGLCPCCDLSTPVHVRIAYVRTQLGEVA